MSYADMITPTGAPGIYQGPYNLTDKGELGGPMRVGTLVWMTPFLAETQERLMIITGFGEKNGSVVVDLVDRFDLGHARWAYPDAIKSIVEF